jgi:hypothetical protein
MRNTSGLPIVSLVIAALLLASVAIHQEFRFEHLNVIELGALAAVVGLLIYGIQGLISVAVDGEELKPGTTPPHLTDALSDGIVIISALLIMNGLTLAYGLADNWGTVWIGLLAGLGCILLAFMLVAYKEAFLGEEARFDRRDDGVPW